MTFAKQEMGMPKSRTALMQNGTAVIKKAAKTTMDMVLQHVVKKARDTNQGYALTQATNLAANALDVQFTCPKIRMSGAFKNQ